MLDVLVSGSTIDGAASEQGCDHADEQKIDDVIHQGRDIWAAEPNHRGERESGKVAVLNQRHGHTHTAVKQGKPQEVCAQTVAMRHPQLSCEHTLQAGCNWKRAEAP